MVALAPALFLTVLLLMEIEHRYRLATRSRWRLRRMRSGYVKSWLFALSLWGWIARTDRRWRTIGATMSE
jgi:hypothetical protein